MSSPGVQPAGWRLFVQKRRKWIIAAVVILVPLLLFHPIENWRGRRTWEKTRQELEARGESFSASAFHQPPVPNDQNRMLHPFMQLYFSKDAVQLGVTHPRYTGLNGAPFMMAQLRNLPHEPTKPKPLRELAAGLGSPPELDRGVIRINQACLADVLKLLFRQANLNAMIENSDGAFHDGFGREIRGDFEWKNSTAVEAIDDLLTRYGLAVRLNPTNQIFQVWPAGPSLEEILQTMKPYETFFQELDEALRRPRASAQAWDEFGSRDYPRTWVNARILAQGLATHARVSTLLGRRETAVRDIHRLRGVVDCLPAYEPPPIVGAMMRVAMAGLLANAVEELLAEGLLAPVDIAAIQTDLKDLDLLGPLQFAQRASRAGTIGWMDQNAGDPGRIYETIDIRNAGLYRFSNPPSSVIGVWREKLLTALGRTPGPSVNVGIRLLSWISPRGWVDQNKATLANWTQLQLADLDPAHHRIDAHLCDAQGENLREQLSHAATPYQYLAGMLYQNLMQAHFTCAKNQTAVDQAFVACALERFRAANGKYPEALAELVPQFTDHLPNDIFDGQPLRYRRTGDGKFLLYSIGWNGVDDKGTMETNSGGVPIWNKTSGDWLWRGVAKK